MADYAIKQGATDPPYLAQLVKADGSAIDLTLASGVSVRIQNGTTLPITFTSQATIVTALTGNVKLTWGIGDSDIPLGIYNVEWIVDFGGGREEIVPSKGFAQIEITKILE